MESPDHSPATLPITSEPLSRPLTRVGRDRHRYELGDGRMVTALEIDSLSVQAGDRTSP